MPLQALPAGASRAALPRKDTIYATFEQVFASIWLKCSNNEEIIRISDFDFSRTGRLVMHDGQFHLGWISFGDGR